MMYHPPRFIGMARTKNLLFGGTTMSAQEALNLGLVARGWCPTTRSRPPGRQRRLDWLRGRPR